MSAPSLPALSALTRAVAVVPVMVTAVTSSAKSSASVITFSISSTQSLPEVLRRSTSGRASTSEQMSSGLRPWAAVWSCSIVSATSFSAPLKSPAEVCA